MRTLLAALLALSVCASALAHETDQYSLPRGRQFADLGPEMTLYFYDVIERAVESVNADIQRRLNAGEKPESFADLHSQDHIIGEVARRIPWAMDVINEWERDAGSGDMQRRYPGELAAFRPVLGDVYFGAGIPIDPRQLIRLFFSSTIRAYDVHFGTDKIGHFTDMGRNYYRSWRGARNSGKSDEEATRAAVNTGITNPILSEGSFLGMITAGSWSNADLVSNYCGFLFYRNLTEPMQLKGQMRPPMLVRNGNYWKLNDHVRPDSDFFSWLVSRHFDETLNPSMFDPTLRGGIKSNVKKRASQLLQRHQDSFGVRPPPAYFAAARAELRTYWGVDYGHKGSGEELINVDELCYAPVRDDEDVTRRDQLGYTPLHRAAAWGDAAKVRALLARGADVKARVISDEPYSSEWGNTALHEAAKAGDAGCVTALLAAGADAGAVNQRGIAPLHLARRHQEITRALLKAGAQATARDVRGRTALHWAAADPQSTVLPLLLQNGADARLADLRGRTALHEAAASGTAGAIEALLGAGAEIDATDANGIRPLHLAAARRAAVPLDRLARPTTINARDDFGRTALHEAARAGALQSVRRLLDLGADVKLGDVYGTTPLHLAARGARLEVCMALLDAGADVNAANKLGGRPIHDAVSSRYAAAVRLLVSRSADRQAKDRFGRSPADLVHGPQRDRIEAILKGNG